MRSGSIVLPKGICGKVEGFGEGRTGGAAEPKPEGFGANAPGPLGFRAAGARRVGSLGRCPTSTFASLLADRRSARETELIEPDLILL